MPLSVRFLPSSKKWGFVFHSFTIKHSKSAYEKHPRRLVFHGHEIPIVKQLDFLKEWISLVAGCQC